MTNSEHYEHRRHSSRAKNARKSGYKYKKNRNRGGDNLLLIIGGAVALGLLAVILVLSYARGSLHMVSPLETLKEENKKDPSVIHEDLYLDVASVVTDTAPISLKGKTAAEAKDAVHALYRWKLSVKNANPTIGQFNMPDLSKYDRDAELQAKSGEGDNAGSEEIVKVDDPLENVTIRPEADRFDLPDLFTEAFDRQIDAYYKEVLEKQLVSETTAREKEEKSSKKDTETAVSEPAVHFENCSLTMPEVSGELGDYMKELALVWKMEPINGDITGYDAEKDSFIFGGSVNGYQLDADKTAQALIKALREGKLDAEVESIGTPIAAGEKNQLRYEEISTFTTNTTDNSVRNKNVSLAADYINGIVLKPKEEFSFNGAVGQRTVEKGFGGAAAYNNGEVVQEIGGGVCQVSSTLYNAVFRAGLTTTYRRSHTFEPSYVTPGTDATVSWPGPDYKFVNNSDHAIGIRAKYKDRKLTVSIFGVRILPEGETWDLSSVKQKDLPPEPVQIITEGTPYAGTLGSEWEVFKVVTSADGKVTKTKDHNAHYAGHPARQFAVPESLPDESTVETDENGETRTSRTTEAEETEVRENGPGANLKKTEASAEGPVPETAGEEQPIPEIEMNDGPEMDDGLLEGGPM